MSEGQGRDLVEPDHMGNGVYCTDQGYRIMLTANHHDPHQASDVIYIEQHELEAIVRYAHRMGWDLT